MKHRLAVYDSGVEPLLCLARDRVTITREGGLVGRRDEAEAEPFEVAAVIIRSPLTAMLSRLGLSARNSCVKATWLRRTDVRLK